MDTTKRANCWSVTINNPTPADYEEMSMARQKGWTVEGQLEKGTEGTLHLQLKVSTPQVRFSAVKKAFARGHIEIARNQAALGAYVRKEESRVAELPTTSDQYPSLSKFWHLIATQLNAGHTGWTATDKEAFHAFESAEAKRAVFYNTTIDKEMRTDPLKVLDRMTENLIAEGYYVEGIASNPAVRSAWNKWWRALCYRSIQIAQAQTDRQTDTRSEAQEVIVPMVHNHADDYTRASSSSGLLEGIYGEDSSPEGNVPGGEESGADD